MVIAWNIKKKKQGVREMKQKFFKDDPIYYHLQNYKAVVKSVHESEFSSSFIRVLVTESNNPEYRVNTTQHIEEQFYKHVELLAEKTYSLYQTDQKDADTMFSFLQDLAAQATRNLQIDKALATGDKNLFMKLTGEGK